MLNVDRTWGILIRICVILSISIEVFMVLAYLDGPEHRYTHGQYNRWLAGNET